MNLISNKSIYRMIQRPGFIFLLKLPMVLAFFFIIFSGLFGSVYKNAANFIVGPVWLLFITLLALLGGKFWCLICPWNALSDWLQGVCFPRSGGGKDSLNLHVPKIFRNSWIALFLFVMIIWLEYSIGLTDKARDVAYLAIVIFAITFIGALLFQRKSFCRYGCPVGAICGIYGLFSPLEIRSADKDICQKCQTKDCIRGNEKGVACPVFEYPATIENNLNCIQCTECVRTCPKNNIAYNLRLPGKDLFKFNTLHYSEVFLIITILALSIFGAFNITNLHLEVMAWAEMNFGISEAVVHLALMAGLIISVMLLLFSLSLVSRLSISGIAYAFLPVALFNHFGNTIKLMALRAEEILPLMSDPFGLSWNLFGTAGHLPKPLFSASSTDWAARLLSTSQSVNPLIWILALLMIIGLLYSAFLTYRLLRYSDAQLTGTPAHRPTGQLITFFLLFFIPMVIIVALNWWLVPK